MFPNLNFNSSHNINYIRLSDVIFQKFFTQRGVKLKLPSEQELFVYRAAPRPN